MLKASNYRDPELAKRIARKIREIAPKKAAAEESARNFAEEQKAKKKNRSRDDDGREERLADAITRQLAYKGLQY